jgi:muramoyltetrapeptide carboxypeptidase
VTVRYPRPLRPGDVIGVTAPSSGVPDDLRPRLAFAVDGLRQRGFEVRLGECLDGQGIVSAPAADRAAELTAMLVDPAVRAVVPPWGGELAVEVLPLLDWDALAQAEPTWLVGYSDTSTLLLPLTLRLGWATLHAANLMDTPYALPEELLSWLDIACGDGPFVQRPAPQHRRHGHDDWASDPTPTATAYDSAGTWRTDRPVRATGRLLGGCTETVSVLAGTAYGDVPGWAAEHPPEGVLLYLEASDDPAASVARHLWRLRLTGWFDVATALLVGRTNAPPSDDLSQEAAVRSALAGLDLPVVWDVDTGHVPPQMSLLNGALAELVVDGDETRLEQRLVP